jgi:hypothetical protein
MGWGSSLRLFGVCVCVFALVFASNVAMVKVRPLVIQLSLENCCHDYADE